MKLQKPRPERCSASNAANLGSTAAAFKRGTFPSDEIAAACASTMAQRSLEDVIAVSLAAASRAESPAQFGQRATAPVERGEALGPSRRSCSFQAAALGQR